MADRSRRVERLSPAKRELLRRRLGERQRGAAGIRAGAAPDEPRPLSFAQERFWFLHLLEPDSAEYNMAGAGRFRGRLDRDALHQALVALARRHAVLRTSFPARDGEPRQVVREHPDLPLPGVDLRARPRGEREAQMLDLARAFAQEPFDLAAGPPVRAKLLRMEDDEHVLLLSHHHIVSDGWSLRILMRELSALYNANVRRAPAGLPPLPIQYGDYAVWQRERLSGARLDELLAYWRGALDGAPPTLELFTDRPRPPLQTHAGETRRYRLSTELATALRGLAAGRRATLFVTLLAAFQTLLHRLAGQDDVVVGTSYANRDRPEIEGLIGPFVNTLAVRTLFADRPSFAALLDRVRATVRDAVAHAELPFEKLVAELAPARDPSRTPVFNVFFDMAVPYGEPPFDGLQVREVDFERGNALFDLALSVAEADGELTAAIEANTDLYDGRTVDRLWGHFEALLEAVVAAPETPVDELPLLSAVERRRIVAGFNATALDYDRATPVHRLFEARASAAPGSVALAEGPTVTTYAGLDARANRLAHRLHGLGVGPGALVGVSLPRSADALAAVLAVWKAGGAYVPLDPEDPPERLRFLVEDSGVSAVVTRADASAALAACDVERLLLDEADLAAQPDTPPAVTTSPDDVAYLIYTSGSTGRPKGVLVPHGALTNHVAWVRSAFDLAPDDRLLLRTPAGFDASIWEIVNPLVAGARLVVTPPGLQRDPARLLELVAAGRVTVLQTVPSLLATWLAEPRFAGCKHLRHLICAGEPLTPELVYRFHALCERAGIDAVLHNLYGPTEACIDATIHTCARSGSRRDVVPIGRPIANARVHVLDGRLAPVPVGVVGELFVGGEGLARGYHRRPELTAERFLDDPLGTGRLYRTGDLGRYLDDGRLEYVGRADDQIKLNGYRIELGEIEAVLEQHAAVQRAAVLADELPGGARRLVAWYAGDATPDELRAFLAERLPRYMVPGVYVALDELPLTASEKVDRRALPPPEPARAASGATVAPPRTDTERALAALFGELLELDTVGVDDDFFHLGGHSLLATRLASRVRDRFGVEVPLLAFFEAPTVAALARTVAAAAAALDEPPVAAPPGTEPVLSFAQERLWFLDRLEPGSTRYGMPGAVRLSGALDPDALERAFGCVLRRHDVLRTVFVEEEGRARARVLPDAGFALAREDVSGLDAAQREARVQARLEAEARRVFDLQRGPLVVATLLCCGAAEHVLVLNQHHVVSDGWSLGVLLEELDACYRAELAGEPPSLAPLALQYADFARWQRERLRGRRLEDELAWWRATLDGAPPRLDLPADRPRPPTPSHRGALARFELSAELSDSLRRCARANDATLFTTLLAAFGALLSRVTGRDDLVVGTVVAGRTRLELEPLLGFFVNALALRIDASGDPSFAELLRRVRRSTGEALAHQEVPFEKLVAELAPGRDASRAPLFQVDFHAVTAPAHGSGLADLVLEELPFDPGTAKLDLSVEVDDRAPAIRGTVEYATELFDPATVERLWSLYERLLTAVAADPLRPVAAVPLLAEIEERFVVEECNDTAAPFDEEAFLHRRCAQRAREAPDALAVVDGERRTSYAELDALAGRLAARLRALGVGPDVVVGLELERSTEQIAALLAVGKAGGAFLPLDPADPPARRERLARDAGALLVLDRARLEAELAADASPAGGAPPPRPDHLAYVMPTSGSTGEPKLVMVPHRALAAHTAMITELLGVTAADRFLQRFPLVFDAALIPIAAAFGAGAAIVLVPEGEDADPRAVLEVAARAGVTVLSSVTSFLRELFESPHLAGCRRLRAAFSGGEAMPPGFPARFHARSAEVGLDVAFFHMYGPAEACIVATAHRTGPEDTGEVPIGRPVANARVHLLDAAGRPVPVGVVGEIHVGGALLARGYAGRPDLTAQRFVPDPFAPGERLYRTGDLGRRLPGGEIVFVGRADDEVKVLGRRVHPAEVEAVLAADPRVREAAVVALAAPGGGARLAAHVVAPGVATDELRSVAAAGLPAALVPTAWRTWDALPRTRNGKVDRRALAVLPEEDRSFEAPRTELEARLAALAAEVLEVEHVGAHDDFFALGGNSLLAVRLTGLVRGELDVELPVRAVFEAPTVAGLALAVGVLRRGGPRRPLDPSAADLGRDALLEADVRPPETPPPAGPPRDVLLTGATGYLGAFLLRELLDRTDARVRCLVRDGGRARVEENMARYGLFDAAAAERIEPFAADLGAPRLGLDAAAYEALAAGVDLIVHAGAAVDFFRGYRALRAVNVEGTRELLRLACRRGAPLHFVSTLGVLLARNARARDVLDEALPLDDLEDVEGGYEQTKWVAEKLVVEAGARGLPVAVHRPGRVAGHSTSGVWNTDDFACRTIAGCIALGAAPDLDVPVDVTPVDHVARAIVALALAARPAGETWHLIHPRPTAFGAVFDRARARGLPVRVLPYGAWHAELAAAVAREPEHPLLPLLPLLAGEAPAAEQLLPDLLLPRVSSERTRERLSQLGIACPAVDDAVIDRWLDFFATRGLLPTRTTVETG